MMKKGAESVFGPDSFLDGDYSCSGLLRIEGRARGKISIDGALVIAQEARVEADIEAQDVIVAGILISSIKAKKSIRLTETAKVRARLSSRVFSMEQGALFEGEVADASIQIRE
ncbi:MAG: polymer-forming cytoskeletal protein, partial [Spirochaetales bacterium]|nr:polymer-forming cytoskeletal protein [Spirochaetales bacterium]